MLKFLKKILLLSILIIFTGCSSTQNKKISKYFTLREATHSNIANRYKIKNKPSWGDYRRIKRTAKRMDKVREALGTPIIVTSWYRNKKVNKKVGGSKTSQHVIGTAVDFKIQGRASTVRDRLKKKKVGYDQLIYYPRQNRIHIGFKRFKIFERNQYFTK